MPRSTGDEADERTCLLESGSKPLGRTTDSRLQLDSTNLGFFERRRRLKDLKQFYEQQDRLVELYAQDAELLSRQTANDIIRQVREDKREQLVWDRRFATIVFIINILIFGGNLTASILSGSYSVISAFIDSTMDIMSSIIVHLTIWAINNTDPTKYPRGRQRLELIAVIGCSIFMGVANIMMIIQSVEAIVTNSVDPDANLPTILIILSSVSTKIIIMIVCYRHGSSNSRILALDQRNDILTNVVALSGAYIGDKYWKFADPLGAILVCRILAITLAHDERIKCLDHMMIYYNGERALVELHIVLDEHLPLKVTHDICETLQDKLNSLAFVERTFIHVDYYCDGCMESK